MHYPSSSPYTLTSAPELRHQRAACVLIATGSQKTGERLGSELRRASFRPAVVADGRQALKAAIRLKPSLLVADSDLPDMTAVTLIRALRRLPRLGKLPAIAVGRPLPGRERDAQRELFALNLGKPVDPPDLLRAVVELLDAADLGGNGVALNHNGNGNGNGNGVALHVTGERGPVDPRELHAPGLQPAEAELERLQRENELLRERLATRSVELAFLAGFGIGISTGSGANGLMDEVLARCAEVTGFDCGAAYLAASHRPPALHGHVGFTDPERLVDFFGDPRLLAEAIALAGDGIVRIPSPILDERRSAAVLRRAQLGTLLVAPVLEAGVLLGVLVLGSSRESATVSQELLISSVAGQMGQWLSRVRDVSPASRSERRTLERLARAAEFRDEETANHTQRVSRYSELLASLSGVDHDRSELIAAASAMHDIGKLGIPDSILRKPGKLTADERTHMQRHADYGRKILAGEPDPLLDLAATIAWTHHERWDGGGYPRGLRGKQIPLEGRIVAIGDVFDALTSNRVYRPAMSVAHAVDLMRDGSARHFDPNLLELFIEAMPRILEIRRRHPDDTRSPVV